MKFTFLFFVLCAANCSSQELIDSTIISRSEAIDIARKNGCVEETDGFMNPW